MPRIQLLKSRNTVTKTRYANIIGLKSCPEELRNSRVGSRNLNKRNLPLPPPPYIEKYVASSAHC